MRRCVGLIAVVGLAAVATGQPPAADKIEPRYGVPAAPDVFPQATVAQAVASAIKAIDKGKPDYLAAHLMDPKSIDGLVAGRAAGLEAAVDRELRRTRDENKSNPDRAGALPLDPAAFADVVRAEAARRGFVQVVESVRARLADAPRTARELTVLARDGTVAEAGDTATVTLRDPAARALNLVRVGGRWFVTNSPVVAK